MIMGLEDIGVIAIWKFLIIDIIQSSLLICKNSTLIINTRSNILLYIFLNQFLMNYNLSLNIFMIDNYLTEFWIKLVYQYFQTNYSLNN